MMQPVSYTDVAAKIGRRLVRDAIWSGDACTWMGWDQRRVSGHDVSAWTTLGPDLGHGTAGVGLFLAELSQATGDRMIRETAYGALRLAFRTSPFDDKVHGFFAGRPGIAIGLILAGKALDDDSMIQQAQTLLSNESRQIGGRHTIFDGAAGEILACLIGHRFCGSAPLFDRAIVLGDKLIKSAVKKDETWSWSTGKGAKGAVGLLFGSDGIACALANLAEASGTSTYADAAEAALRYTAQHFNAPRQLWTDTHVNAGLPHLASTAPSSFPIGLDYGATGIFLARQALTALLPNRKETQSERDIALAAIVQAADLSRLPMQNFSMASGVAGLTEALLEASLDQKRADLSAQVAQIAQYGTQYHHAMGLPWRTGAANTGDTPGLLNGLAGIGRLYLRLHDAASSPSVVIPAVAAFHLGKPEVEAEPAPEPAVKVPKKEKPTKQAAAVTKPKVKPAPRTKTTKAAATPKPQTSTDAKIAKKRAKRPKRPRPKVAKPRHTTDQGRKPEKTSKQTKDQDKTP
ncbi:MAG: lanthionine synthetase LanC family protein [Litoreibacter sp.]